MNPNTVKANRDKRLNDETCRLIQQAAKRGIRIIVKGNK